MNPTPYKDINYLIIHLLKEVKAILGNQFFGMYLYGSLALGDFNYKTSDIDILVITRSGISNVAFEALYKMHEDLKGTTIWDKKLEVAYIAKEVFNNQNFSQAKLYPQIEKERKLAKEPLEIGWAFQYHTLYEYGIVIEGPAPKLWMEPIDALEMKSAAINIVEMWKDQAINDPTWLEWVKMRKELSFVILTLCRFFYLLKFNTTTSKSKAAQFALDSLDNKWHELIKNALISQQSDCLDVSNQEIKNTMAMLAYTHEALKLSKA